MKLSKLSLVKIGLCLSVFGPSAFAAGSVSVIIDGQNYSCSQGNTGGTKSVICAKDGNGNFYPARVDDGRPLGNGTSIENCKRSISAEQSGLVCAKDGNGNYYPARITDGSPLGNGTSLDNCMASIGGN